MEALAVLLLAPALLAMAALQVVAGLTIRRFLVLNLLRLAIIVQDLRLKGIWVSVQNSFDGLLSLFFLLIVVIDAVAAVLAVAFRSTLKAIRKTITIEL